MRAVAMVAGSLLGGCAIAAPRAALSTAPHLAASDSADLEGKPAAELPPRAPPATAPTVPFDCRGVIGHCEVPGLEQPLDPAVPPKPKSPPPKDSAPGTKI